MTEQIKATVDKADGTNLVYVSKHAGTKVEKILLATKRDGEIRIIVDDNVAFVIDGDKVRWAGRLRGIDKALAAIPGSEFRGWKRTKQYRLTDAEISEMVKGRVFQFAGILF